jgi:hypothetical protein
LKVKPWTRPELWMRPELMPSPPPLWLSPLKAFVFLHEFGQGCFVQFVQYVPELARWLVRIMLGIPGSRSPSPGRGIGPVAWPQLLPFLGGWGQPRPNSAPCSPCPDQQSTLTLTRSASPRMRSIGAFGWNDLPSSVARARAMKSASLIQEPNVPRPEVELSGFAPGTDVG